MHRSRTSALGVRLQVAVALAVTVGAACSQSPTSPTSLTSSGVPSILAARPSGSAAHLVAFEQIDVPDTDGLFPGRIEASPQTLTGSITGSQSDNTLRVVVSGPYTWTITDVNNLGNLSNGTSCTQPEKDLLLARGLIGPASSISGVLSFEANMKDQRIDWSMTGITDNTGAAWGLGGNSTINYRPIITGDTTSARVVMESVVIGFKLNPRGRVGADQTIGCRVDFTATIVRSN